MLTVFRVWPDLVVMLCAHSHNSPSLPSWGLILLGLGVAPRCTLPWTLPSSQLFCSCGYMRAYPLHDKWEQSHIVYVAYTVMYSYMFSYRTHVMWLDNTTLCMIWYCHYIPRWSNVIREYVACHIRMIRAVRPRPGRSGGELGSVESALASQGDGSRNSHVSLLMKDHSLIHYNDGWLTIVKGCSHCSNVPPTLLVTHESSS